MSEREVLERNLLSLSMVDAALAGRVRDSRPHRRFEIVWSRSGMPVPAFSDGVRQRALHSTMDPVREGERISAGHTAPGYYVCYGLGAGYHILPLLARDTVSGVLILETEIELLRSTLEEIDLHNLFLAPRVHLMVDPNRADVAAYLLHALIRTIQSLSPGRRIELTIPHWQSKVMEAANAAGCVAHVEYHRMGMLV